MEEAMRPAAVHVDHFLPRESYPALAAHPCNRVPLCATCNGPAFKGRCDPLGGDDDAQRRSAAGALTKTFMPYTRGALDALEVEFHGAGMNARITAIDPEDEEAVASVVRLFGLEERWTSAAVDLYAKVTERLLEGETLPTREGVEAELRWYVDTGRECGRRQPLAWLEGRIAEAILATGVNALRAELERELRSRA
jgi:hypothetical protein